MSTSPNNNDPLEEFFREKAQDYDITYRKEDWKKLESRLDDANQQYKQRQRRRLVAAAAVILFAVLAYVTYTQQLKINELDNQLSDKQTVSPTPPAESPTKESENDNGDLAYQSLSDNKTANSQNSDKQSIRNQASKASKLSSKDNSEKETHLNKARRVYIPEKSLAIAKASSMLDGKISATSTIKPIDFSNTKSTNTNKKQYQSENPQSSNDLLAQHRRQTFSIGLIGGPDLSTVGSISSFHNPGYSLGISFEYYITNNLAISVGAHRTKVQYVASSNEYQLPDGYLTYGATPEQTEGICLLIDIPISLKYTFKNFQHSRIFASAGLSSYIMLNEDYRFQYDTNQPQLQQRWQERTGTRHWMSNTTLSIGYELDISRTISLRAEPFIKLPLKEVGWGNVNLYSVGSFFSINYHIK